MSSEPYRADLAHIHDTGFGRLATEAGRLLAQSLHDRSIRRGLIVDLGCGSGLLSEIVASAGFEVLGVDLSPAMLAIARRRVPSGRFEQESVFDAIIPPCVAVAAVGEVLNYLFDVTNSAERLVPLLRRIHQSLVPGGLFIGDIAGPGRIPTDRPVRNWTETDDWSVLVASELQDSGRSLARHIVTFRRQGDLYQRDQETHLLRLISPDSLMVLLESAGLEVCPLSAYGSFRFLEGWHGFLALKP